jgi:hypothetical protein
MLIEKSCHAVATVTLCCDIERCKVLQKQAGQQLRPGEPWIIAKMPTFRLGIDRLPSCLIGLAKLLRCFSGALRSVGSGHWIIGVRLTSSCAARIAVCFSLVLCLASSWIEASAVGKERTAATSWSYQRASLEKTIVNKRELFAFCKQKIGQIIWMYIL